MTQDFNATTDLVDAANPAISYIEDDARWIVHTGILIASGTEAVHSTWTSSQLINDGNINSGAGDGVLFGGTGAFIQNNAGATITGLDGVFFDTGTGNVTNHGKIVGLTTNGTGVYFNNGSYTQVLTNDGVVFGRTFGVNVYGDTINNKAGGLIVAYSGTAIAVGQSFLTPTTINNAAGATIKGGIAIDAGGQDCGIHLNNYGSVIGTLNGGNYADTVLNHHLIRGSINLGAGNDVYDGHSGKVTGPISGGDGNDTLTGGGGADKFLFNAIPNAATNHDTITNFNPGQGDRIELSKADFAGIGPIGTLHAQFFRGQPHAATASQHILYNQATGFLSYDEDGKGTAHAPVHFATLSTHPALVAGDFIVVA